MSDPVRASDTDVWQTSDAPADVQAIRSGLASGAVSGDVLPALMYRSDVGLLLDHYNAAMRELTKAIGDWAAQCSETDRLRRWVAHLVACEIVDCGMCRQIAEQTR